MNHGGEPASRAFAVIPEMGAAGVALAALQPRGATELAAGTVGLTAPEIVTPQADDPLAIATRNANEAMVLDSPSVDSSTGARVT